MEAVLGVKATLVRGGGGVFDVEVDGKLCYSKFQTHQFPDEDALVAQLRAGAQ